jgi:hypothetical protein
MSGRIDRRLLTADRQSLTTGGRFSAIVCRLPSAVRGLAVYFGLSALVVTAYLITAQVQNAEFGFPLDDAWIHQVYARNIGTRGEFAFFPGQPSAGSTSPLWALLLSTGYALRVDSRVWTILLGAVLLALSALLSTRIASRLGAPVFVARWLVPAFIVLEWHLAWAAVSGMEITLFVFLSLAVVELLLASSKPLWIGVLAGLLTLTRPEGAAFGLLVGVALGANALREGLRIATHTIDLTRYSKPLTFAVAFALPLVPYVAFNIWSSGTIFPNTFYAKSQEYSELLSRANFIARWLVLYRQPFLGAQILLLPGLVWMGWQLFRGRQLGELIALVWVLLLPALYAARLPVDYQFGRYEMPIIPFIAIYGIVGTGRLLARIRVRAIRRAWGLAIAVLVVAFLPLGANQYARSVAIINCEMVATARWTAANLPAGALIAVHDIGAQGYFDPHPMLDLAGLVSPEVIPFIRDESRLRDWMKARGTSYAIFFPTWYRQLARDLSFVPVHSENCAVTHAAGEVDLKVYRITR